MCGICGILNFSPEELVEEKLLLGMRDLMIHRGPDEAGVHINQNIGLAHRRLSIIDLASGQQPMTNEDGTVWIVYNGEIYNYTVLRAELVSRGHLFKTNSDTEVIIHAYEEFGEGCLEGLRGMFAFAIWDDRKKSLFAARDRLGKKPFYYVKIGETLIFSSEIKSLLIHPKVDRKLCHEAFYFYLNVRYVPGPFTMFDGIFKLQPGHFMVADRSGIKIKKYWNLNRIEESAPRKISKERLEEKFLGMLEECVNMRLMSEVPLGVFLSGGIDSSVIVALMSRMSNRQIKTFSVGYEEDFGTNEFGYARMVAQMYHTDHYEYPISKQSFYEFLPKLVWHMDEPISDPASIPLFFLSEFSKKYVTVVLSGEGADEILGGYYIYKKMLFIEKFRRMPEGIRNGLLLRGASTLFRNDKVQKYIDQARLPLERRYKGVSRAFEAKALDSALKTSNGYAASLDNIFGEYFEDVKGRDPLNQMLYVDTKTWLPDDLLMKADKMTMAASQELRVPFLDHKLVEFAFTLPGSLKVDGKRTKALLRNMSRGLIPDPIIRREKKGFPIPISQWFRGDLNDVSREVLLDNSSACKEFLDANYVSMLLKKHADGGADFSEKIWNLLVFEYWYKEFMSLGEDVR